MTSFSLFSHPPERDIVASDAVNALKRRLRSGCYEQPISLRQRVRQKDSDANGPKWVSRVTLLAPQHGKIMQALYATMENVGGPEEEVDCMDANAVHGEWLRLPPGVSITEPEPTLSEHEGYQRSIGIPPMLQPDFLIDDVWPTNSPRGDRYCDTQALCHPLVSPVAVRGWRGPPAMLIVCREERCLDSNKLLAQRATAQGVCVQWQ